jgi:ATP phosphoribosyltransferase
MATSELSPLVPPTLSVTEPDVFRQFQAAETKIAIQKDGELTRISQEIIADYFGWIVPAREPSDKRMAAVSEDGEVGYAFVRNKDIGTLVANKMVDFAVIGVDRLIEEDIESEVEVVDSYEDQYRWPLVLAVPAEGGVDSLIEMRRIATQYPRTAARFFEAQGLSDVEIIPTNGSTELYPYLGTSDAPIDGVIDMRVTGSSLAAHDLREWPVTVETAFPVLIKPKETENV